MNLIILKVKRSEHLRRRSADKLHNQLIELPRLRRRNCELNLEWNRLPRIIRIISPHVNFLQTSQFWRVTLQRAFKRFAPRTTDQKLC